MKRFITHIKDRLQGKAPKGSKRSSQWPKIRNEHLKKNSQCAVCGGTAKLEVHHKVPFHLDPSKELEPSNLITLCEAWKNGICCHLLIGHLGNYKKQNLEVEKDAEHWNEKLKKPKA